MRMRKQASAMAAVGIAVLGMTAAGAQQKLDPQAELIAKRNATESELAQVAIIERKVMVKMRDGKLMAADVYRPKAAGKVPVIFSRTPYNFNFWDVKLGAPRDMSAPLAAVKHGYAYVEMQERGHFFSQGNYDILGMPLTDATDALKWMRAQPWSTGKVGTTGCSSTAEWQLAAVAQDDPALATFNVQGFGAGVGQVGPYFEQGNWYRGGAMQMLFISWIYDYGIQNQVRPQFPADTTREALVNASHFYDLATQMPPVDWDKAFWHLPEKDIIKAVGGPPGIFDTTMPVATGGNMVARAPNDPTWYKGGLWHENMKINRPGLWFMSWFDVSVSPNLAAYNQVRQTADKAIADQQYAVIAPVLHCAYKRATEHTMVGDMDMGDARFDYDALTYGWFDQFLKGEDSPALAKQPKVMYYLMGANRWKNAQTWPPAGATQQTLFLGSDGRANTLYGDGRLQAATPAQDAPDRFVYDPANPVRTLGGGGCCQGKTKFGSFDQREQEARNDILVYQTETLQQGLELSGPITLTLYVDSSAKDTDFTFKLIDVQPDGRSFNITENIQRMRYRDGYDKRVWMEPGKVAKVTFQPIDTAYYFKPGHRLRLDVSSSNFPRFDRNLNTGGNNYDEDHGVIAHNAVHHGAQYPSSVTLTVMPDGGAAAAD
jgi:uncharacterized protein